MSEDQQLQQEFLDMLKNPLGMLIDCAIDSFMQDITYYSWDKVWAKSICKDGCHDIYVTVADPTQFNKIERLLGSYFPTSPGYTLVTTKSIARSYGPPSDEVTYRNDVHYSKMYAVVEASCYDK